MRTRFRLGALATCGLVAMGMFAGCGGSSGTDTKVIAANDDTATVAAGQTSDLLTNDRLDGAAVSAAAGGNVSFSIVSGTVPTGVSISSAGVVSVTAAAASGSFTVTYRLCEAASSSNCDTATATIAVPTSGTVTGRVVDASTSAGVSGVRVKLGTLTATTDATGAFSLTGVAAAARATLVFTSDTYAETAAVAAIGSGTTDVQVRMLRTGVSTAMDVAAGGTITLTGSTARVVLPASSLQRADGTIPTGNVQVRLTPIDPASDTSVMPGDFTTLVSGNPVPIESFGALNVVLTDSAGVALNLRSGQTASLRIPLASRNASPPATIPLFYFDTTTGRWVQEGTATLAGTAPNRYYEGTVTHFTTWNADQVANTVVVNGCVANAAGTRVAGAQVAADGIDYSGTSQTTTGSDGSFSLPIRVSSQATVVALSGGLLSNTLRVGPYSSATTLTDCLVLGQTSAGITMKLTWGALPTDLDSHLLLPDGSHVYYSSKGNLLAAPFANLDVDDTSSYGPEVVTITKLMVGTYKYYIYNWSGYSSGPIASSSARVELNIPGRAAELFTAPTTGETSSTNYWQLFEFDVAQNCTVTLRRVGIYSSSAPSSSTGTATYCTP